MTETVKVSQKEKVTKKYGAMVSYYAELLGLCHQAVAKNATLSKLSYRVKRLQRLLCLSDLVQEWTKE